MKRFTLQIHRQFRFLTAVIATLDAVIAAYLTVAIALPKSNIVNIWS